MTGPVTDAEREADLRRRVRHQIRVPMFKSQLQGRRSPFEDLKIRRAWEAFYVSGAFEGPPEKLENPMITRFDPARPFDPDPLADPPS